MQAYDLSKLTVLVVEERAPIRTLLRQVLREFGVQNIHDAVSPEVGFETFNDINPDLVLVDWAPNFDGIGLVKNIRTNKASKNPWVPVIMLTAYHETKRVYEALDAGMTEYLAKPVSAKLLYTRIVSVIESERCFIRAPDYVGPNRRRHQRRSFGSKERREEEADLSENEDDNNASPENGEHANTA